MNKFIEELDSLWGTATPTTVTTKECWDEYCKRNKLSGKPDTVIAQLTFDQFDALQREFTSKSIVKCIACGSDHVDWRSVQTCRADESETIFAECKTCKKKWRFR
jgi:DNA-directed RNA polymerase subunit M/transcription elongation factor TFIIS